MRFIDLHKNSVSRSQRVHEPWFAGEEVCGILFLLPLPSGCQWAFSLIRSINDQLREYLQCVTLSPVENTSVFDVTGQVWGYQKVRVFAATSTFWSFLDLLPLPIELSNGEAYPFPQAHVCQQGKFLLHESHFTRYRDIFDCCYEERKFCWHLGSHGGQGVCWISKNAQDIPLSRKNHPVPNFRSATTKRPALGFFKKNYDNYN